MPFADSRPGDDDVYASAARRLAQARDEQSRLVNQLALAEGSSRERQAARQLAAGLGEVTVREAWMVCVERGVFPPRI